MNLFHSIVVLILFVGKAKALICYECKNAPSNEECNAGFNGGLRNCPSNALSCENLVQTHNGQTLYFKQCKQPEACRNNMKGNNGGKCRPRNPIHSECWCCCEGEDRCNEAALPCLTGPTPITRQEPTPSPQPLTCSPPEKLRNGGRICDSEPLLNGRFLLQSTCRYFCNKGYTRVGPSTTTCEYIDRHRRTATFSSLSTRCLRCDSCQTIKTIENGLVTCPEGSRVGATCEFSCIDGYSLYPPNIKQVECLRNRKWNNQIPCCLETCKSKPLDLVFILDSSSSIGEANWKVMLQFSTRFISNLNIKPDALNVGVFRYNSKVDQRSRIFLDDFVNDKAGLMKAVERIPYNGEGTLTGNALRYARTIMFNRKNGHRPEAAKVILVVTDGRAQDDDLVITESEALRNEGVITYAIGIRTSDDDLDFLQLYEIAGSVDQIIIVERGFEELIETLAPSLGQPVCETRYCPGTNQ